MSAPRSGHAARAIDAPLAAAAREAALRLVLAAQRTDWRGSDPYDGLWWGWPVLLRGGPRRRQAIVQIHARAPCDIRRLYRRAATRNPKALALFGEAAARLGELGCGSRATSAAREALDLLRADRSAGCAGWGYPFDVQTRWSFYPAHTPNIVVTAFAGLALHRAARMLDADAYQVRARQAAQWVLDELFLADEGIFAYHPRSRELIHNANLLGARFVARVLRGESDAERAVATALQRTLAAQAPDGAFPYGPGRLSFIDSFHTGFVLECLADLSEEDAGARHRLAIASRHYAERFFGERGQARLWPDRPYPEDAHAAGTALTTLARLHRDGLIDEELLARVVARTLSHGLRGDHAVCRRYRWGLATTVRYPRWCDAHVALGLVNAARLSAGGPGREASTAAPRREAPQSRSGPCSGGRPR